MRLVLQLCVVAGRCVCVSRWGLGDASCCCWSWSPLSVLTSTRSLSCYLWAKACHCHPVPALSHNTFISRPSVSQYPAPHHTTSVISTSGPTSLRLLTRVSGPQGQGDCGVQVILSVSNDSSLWHFLNLEKRFESEPSSQEEVKFFMVEDIKFHGTNNDHLWCYLNFIRGKGFRMKTF